MKYIYIFTGLAVLFIVGFLMVTAPTVKSLSECLSAYNSTMGNNIAVAKKEKWNRETLCRNARPATISLLYCYNSVGAKSILPLETIFTVTKLIRPGLSGGDIKQVISLHNSSCSDYPETQVR